jgi:hypothetical protein
MIVDPESHHPDGYQIETAADLLATPDAPPRRDTMTTDPAIQPLPPLTEEEYNALRADIEAHGVLVPIDVDEEGTILDGHHRARAAAELGIDCPKRVVSGLTAGEKWDHALRLNLQRRHLSSAQKRDLIREELLRAPSRSDRAIARLLGVDHKTVGTMRRGEIPHEERLQRAREAVLQKCEDEIQRYCEAQVQGSRALAEIRREKLYVEAKHVSFWAYCEHRWDMTPEDFADLEDVVEGYLAVNGSSPDPPAEPEPSREGVEA